MKKNSTATKVRRRAKLLASCNETRRLCNQLSDEERDRLREKALQLIYSSDANASTGSR